MVAEATFGPGLFTFLADLRANNDREWFAANKQRYEEHVLEPALAFVAAFAPRLERISPHLRADARPSGGSLFRIYRDTRFSKDKTPYKTNIAGTTETEGGASIYVSLSAEGLISW